MSIVGRILGDCLGVKGIPTGAASAAIGKLMGKRHALLREVIRSEIRQGNFNRIDEDELIGMFFRLIRDAEEGVAKNNLRLMARVINGMADKKKLKAASFLNYANILAGLTEDEITVLGIMAQGAINVIKERNTCFDSLVDDKHKIKLEHIKDPGSYELQTEIPEYRPIQQALLRTGLIVMGISSETTQTKKPDCGNQGMYSSGREEPDFDVETISNYIFKLTPLMGEILQYIKGFNFKEAAA